MENKQIEYAGFWKRFAATIIDGVLIVFFSSSLKWAISDSLSLQADFGYEESQNIAYIIWSIYLIFIRWCYFSGMESSPLKATIGKIAVGLYVVDLNGNRIGFGQASGRFFAKILSGLILGVGYLMAGFTQRKQAMHDQISECLVLKK